mgnify:CR=1 FL=1
MKYEVQLKDENGKVYNFTIEKSKQDEEKSLNDFILDSLLISEDKRKLPFYVYAPNGTPFYPSIKMQFDGNFFDGNLKAMVLSWRD